MNLAPFSLPPLIWADQLVVEPEEEHHWIVPGLFERGDRMIITGGEGEGKSTFLRQLALQIASGIHPFTLESVPPQRVMLVDLENSRDQIKAEIEKICSRAGIAVPGEPWLSIANWPSGLDLTNSSYELAVSAVFKEYQPQMVIGGPMYKMIDLSLADEEASKKLSAALDRLRADFGCAMVWEAHQINETTAFDTQSHSFRRDRAARPFGSSLWRRWPEYGICLFNDGTLFHWRKDRQARQWPQKMQRDGDVWLWQTDMGKCPVCGEERPDGKEMYCSDRCKETAKKRRQRLKETVKLEVVSA